MRESEEKERLSVREMARVFVRGGEDGICEETVYFIHRKCEASTAFNWDQLLLPKKAGKGKGDVGSAIS